MFLQKNDHILFYGDSITDCDRSRTGSGDELLGTGYVRMCYAMLQARHPDLNLKITNKGVSGNRVYDLEERFSTEVLALVPQVVSFLVGINDTWRRFDSNVESPVKEFKESYQRMLNQLKDRGICIVIAEPFLLPVPEDRIGWRIDLDPRIQVIRELAVEFGALYLPLDGFFAQASARKPCSFWLPDGVHPSAAGHGLIADQWVKLVTS